MKVVHLAVVTPVEQPQSDHQTMCNTVWQKTTALLLTRLGEYYSRFEPAPRAFKKKISHPFSVITGKHDPAEFLYFYNMAKTRQQDAIKHHMKGLLDGIEPMGNETVNGISVYSVEVNAHHEETGAHMLWHLAIMTGELMPDCGIYFAEELQAYADDQTDKKVLSNIANYAICIVALVV